MILRKRALKLTECLFIACYCTFTRIEIVFIVWIWQKELHIYLNKKWEKMTKNRDVDRNPRLSRNELLLQVTDVGRACHIFHLFKVLTCAHWFVYMFVSLIYCTHLTWSSWSTCPVALQWQGLDCLLIAVGFMRGALGMNNSCPRWGSNDVMDALP